MPYVETMNHTPRNFVRASQATCRYSYLAFGQTSPDHRRTYVHLAHGKGVRTNDFHPPIPVHIPHIPQIPPNGHVRNDGRIR